MITDNIVWVCFLEVGKGRVWQEHAHFGNGFQIGEQITIGKIIYSRLLSFFFPVVVCGLSLVALNMWLLRLKVFIDVFIFFPGNPEDPV